jgi:hypothetical protein
MRLEIFGEPVQRGFYHQEVGGIHLYQGKKKLHVYAPIFTGYRLPKEWVAAATPDGSGIIFNREAFREIMKGQNPSECIKVICKGVLDRGPIIENPKYSKEELQVLGSLKEQGILE